MATAEEKKWCKEMPDVNYQKQAQDYYAKAPIIILGSGASAAQGMPRMDVLAKYLLEKIYTTDLPDSDSKSWKNLCKKLNDGMDLENSLQKVEASPELTSRIVKATWELINSEDINVFQKSLQNSELFPLSRLLEHMFNSSLKRIGIVTTNYDRLAEYACDQACFHHYTGFSHGLLRQFEAFPKIKAERKVNIWKVHGSVDWFRSLQGVVALPNIQSIPDHYQPQIVTPGNQKYQKTHLEPFRSIIGNADIAINDASSYLCIGYGFNDEHIQPKLMERCLTQNASITIITRSLSDSAKKLILGGKVQNYLAIEQGKTDGQSTVYSSLEDTPFTVGENIWSLEGYLSLIT